ncbi:hypothetical protein VP1G_06787 [Cytospora mali]|uniref:DUF7729 domain-containing protein n=1 Tax=Cytospora mali TaxID=578113 RepID=A0A194V6P2_CYTMA|nr:hypothetical protein VP1G_06787 [Valsa mali var. pyri (nom. inval.)]
MASFNTLLSHRIVREAAPLRTSNFSTARHHRPRIQWATTALCLALSLASHTLAFPLLEELPEPTAAPDPAETLLLDTQIPVLLDPGRWTMLDPEEHELRRRAAAADVTATSTFVIPIPSITSTETSTVSSGHSKSSTAAKSSTDAGSSASSTLTSTSTSSATATTSLSSLPSPFDGGLSNNFTTTTCPTFINNMLADAEFQACYPVSLLLQSSESFFDAEKSLVSITQVLDHACQANATQCTNYLADMAKNLTASGNCAADYEAGNPIATEAYLGLLSYPVMYSATCLKDPDTAVYCFGNAVTNRTNPTETYFYSLPLNSSLPGGTIPICASCLQETMNIYQVATTNRKQPISYTYESAAAQVNLLCGPNFANETLPNAIVSSSGVSDLGQEPSTWMFFACFLVMAVNWLLL